MAALGLLLAVCYLAVDAPWMPLVLTVLSGAACVAGVYAGVIRHRPSYRLPWWLVMAAFVSTMIGGVLVACREWPSPGLPDVFFLAQYPLLAAPMVLWMRRRGQGRDLVAWIDVAAILVAVGTLSWLFLIVPAISGVTLGVAVLSASYTTCDLLVFGTGLRMALGGGRAVPALLLIGAGVGLFLLGDVLNAVSFIYWHADAELPWITVLYLPAAPLVGAAGLHPSMVSLQHRDAGTRERGRLLFLGAAMVVGPVALSIGHYDGDDRYVVVYAASTVVLSALVMTRMWLLIQRQRWLAVTDGLTGLRTRRYFEEALATAVARNGRTPEAFGILLLDVDHFKRVNDTRGHGAGDRVLQELADRLRRSVRAGDVVARYGGEEFVVLLAHADADATCTAAEHVRAAIAAEPFDVGEDPPLPVTVSIGVATSGGPGAQLLLQADRCLYAAKEQGRNRVVAADSTVTAESTVRARRSLQPEP